MQTTITDTGMTMATHTITGMTMDLRMQSHMRMCTAPVATMTTRTDQASLSYQKT